MTPDLSVCETCGAPLDPSAPGGLCRRCLLAQAMQPTEPSAGAERQPPPSIETVQAAFSQLEVLEFVGQGGMGWVFKARQPKLNRFVALKLLPSSLAERDAAFAGRFEREGQLLARLHHPNIVVVHDSGAAGEFFYLVMEYVEGVNLRQAMRSSRFTPAQALAIVPHICDALQYAHDEGVLHRDIKPENILLDAKGRVKLADFGIAKLIDGTAEAAAGEGAVADPDLQLTHAGTTLGTPSYMAPEQRDTPADVDHRADIYSLGVVFYELLTGELPTEAFAAPSTKSATDPRVDVIVQQALEKERTRRQGSAGEMKTQVETISERSRSAPESAPAGSLLNPPRFSRTALAGAAWAPFFFGAATFLAFERRTPFPEGYSFAATMGIFLSLAACFGTTILGWISVVQIRRSAGKLHGLGLAVFDGLLFPLLALGSVIACLWMSFGKLLVDFYANPGNLNNPPVHPPLTTRVANLLAQHPEMVKLGAVLMVIVVSGVIIRTVWRKVNQTNRGAPAPRIPWWLFVGAPVLVMTGLLGLLCVTVWSLRESNGRPAVRSDAVGDGEFGPVNERVIAVGATEQSFFNFERGFIPAPIGFDPTDQNSAGKLWEWNTAHQVDLFARQKDGKPTLVFSEMVQTGLNEEDFDRLTPAQLKNLPSLKMAVDAGLRPQEASLGNPGNLRGKHTWAFQTRFETVGILQELGVTSDPPGVKIRYKLLPRSEVSTRAASPALLAEKPRLRFLAWQDELDTRHPDRPSGAFDADGAAVTDREGLRLLGIIPAMGCNFSANREAEEKNARFLHLWFSHPLFDRQSLNEVTLLDSAGGPVKLGALGMMSANAREADNIDDHLGWLTHTLSPGKVGNIPETLTVQLRYTVGPWEQQRQFDPGEKGIVALGNGSQFSAIGQDAQGKTFFAVAVDMKQDSGRQFGVVAVTKDGRELPPNGGSSGGGNGEAVHVTQFIFDAPLADVAQFRLGTRPIRTVEFKNVPTKAKPPVPAVFGLQGERTMTTNDGNRDGVVGFRFKDDVPIRPPDALTSHFQNLSTSGFTPELKQWMRDNNVDLLFHFSAKFYDVFTLDMRDGFGGQPTDWNTIVPGGVFPVLAKLEALNSNAGPGVASGCGYRDGRSAVKVFRTRTGLVGYYQLHGLDDLDGRGVEIRYKIVQSPDGQDSHSLSSMAKESATTARAFIGQLPHGTVELLALTEYPIPNPMVWTPDGRPFKGKSPWEGAKASSGMHVSGGMVAKEVAFRISSEDSPSEPVIRFDKNAGMDSPYTSTGWEDEGRTILFKAEISAPSEAEEAEFQIGVAEGEWETVLHVPPPLETLPMESQKVEEADGLWEARLESVTGEGGDLAVTSLLFHYSIKEDFETRVASRRDDGVVTPLKGADGSVTRDGLNNSVVKMAAVNYEKIKEFLLQRRRYHWIQFSHVSLKLDKRAAAETP